MSESKKSDSNNPGNSFDLNRLRELIQMMEDHGVTEISLRNESEQWKLRRGPEFTAMPSITMPAVPAVPAPVSPAPAAAPAAGTPAAPADTGASTAGLLEIKSPTVGTFYSKPSPDDPDFVKVGSQVKADSIVCLVEAMKVFNSIPAECSGIVEKILVKDGDAVDFGQVMFLVRPA